MKAKIVVGLMILVILGASAGFYLYTKPAEQTVSRETDYTIAATVLFEEFTRDEALATQKYLDKVINVKGSISEISAVDSVGVNIVLETGNPLFGVSCRFSNANGKALYRKGDVVSIKGLCTGKLMDVVLVRCVFDDEQITKQ